jgi:excisionase family DNA binding protein
MTSETTPLPPPAETAPAPVAPNGSAPLLPHPSRLAFTVQEAAQMLGVSDKTVRRLIDRRLLRASRALRHLRIPKNEIERFLEDTCA